MPDPPGAGWWDAHCFFAPIGVEDDEHQIAARSAIGLGSVELVGDRSELGIAPCGIVQVVPVPSNVRPRVAVGVASAEEGTPLEDRPSPHESNGLLHELDEVAV